jgi:hypothetical protein
LLTIFFLSACSNKASDPAINAPDKALHIVNCNQYVVVALMRRDSNLPVWGGAPDACWSPSIIIPAKSTLSFAVEVSNAEQPLTDEPYTIQVSPVPSGYDYKSPPIPIELVTSNEFRLLP